MKTPKFAAISLFLTSILPWSLPGQVYMPDTEYHDLSQRCFVVEAARILAWRENEKKPTLFEVTYTVQTDAKRQTKWQIKWLDKSGTTLRAADVSYPESLLTEGPAFYRQVFAQLWKLKWRPVPKASEQELVRRFWLGAELVGVSRTEGVTAALKAQQAGLPEESLAPQLAGVLQNTALPSLSGALSLDAVLLARSAAWWCLAETMAGAPGKACDACWAPTLFLAGREKSALDLWKQAFPGESSLAPEASVARGWNFFLQRPRAKAAYLYAVKKGNERFALPLMTYYARVADLNRTLVEVLNELSSSEAGLVPRLYDYAPYLATCGVEGGRLMEGAYPALARLDWLKAMSAIPAMPFDYRAYTNALTTAIRDVTAAMKGPDRQLGDASLLGLKETAAVLTNGWDVGMGPLTPVATVIAREMLNYGWESSCWQMTVRHRFVRDVWGVRELADTIEAGANKSLVGRFLFTGGMRANPGITYPETKRMVRRVEFVDLNARALGRTAIPVWGDETNQNAKWWVRRCWLRPGQLREQAKLLSTSEAMHELVPFLKRFCAEGGASAQKEVLEFRANDLSREMVDRLAGIVPFAEELTRELIEPSFLQVQILWEKKYQMMPYMQRGLEFERMFWESGTAQTYVLAYENYLLAKAYDSARRFYRQLTEVVQEPIAFSNQLGMERFVQAFLEGDKAGMEKALEDSASGSASHMMMLAWHAVIRNDTKALAEQLDETISRYRSRSGPDAADQRMKRFVPLIPALQDPKHPDHATALDYFVTDGTWAVMQWFMIKSYGLSTEDAIRFLGGEQTDLMRQAFLLYLKKDKALFKTAFERLQNNGLSTKSRFVLLGFMANELLEESIPAEQPDLRPKGFQTISQTVREAMAHP